MKLQLTVLFTFISFTYSSAQVALTKNEFESILQETLKKSRNAVSNAENNWRYDNTNEDYFKKDTIVLKTARSYRVDYCKEIRWSFYENQKFIIENTPECTEPPTMLKPKDEDFIVIECIEKNGNLYLLLKNYKGICDTFKVLELYRNKPIEAGESAFDYTLKLTRKKLGK
jgi:hypothetical protein